jgi:hypothetical protein
MLPSCQNAEAWKQETITNQFAGKIQVNQRAVRPRILQTANAVASVMAPLVAKRNAYAFVAHHNHILVAIRV